MSDTATIASPTADHARLDEWLRRQESLNPRLMDLGLDRCRRAAAGMDLHGLPMPVVTVAGTNGKGSCVAYLARVLERAGYTVAAYTSPFLHRYNESLRIGGREVSDGLLIAAFENVERARGDVALTFFEFRTLAALDIIRRSRAAVAVLEVGLGGRLDAVNMVDADVAVVTSVDLDHMDWLGPDRESIGAEKAGIFRQGRPAVCGDASPPASLLEHARAIGSGLHVAGAAYSWHREGDAWCWQGAGVRYEDLPPPAMPGEFQYDNAATALMALGLLPVGLEIDPQAVRQGIASARLPGRQQIIPGDVERVIDVAHNPEAARALAATLARRPVPGRTHAVCAMLADKDPSAVAGALEDCVDAWYTATLDGPRGQDGEELASMLRQCFPARSVSAHPDVPAAWRAALAGAAEGDRVIAFGSFHTARDALVIEHG